MRAQFERQVFFSWIGVFGEVAFNISAEDNAFAFEFCQLVAVDLLRLHVVSGQRDVFVFLLGLEIGNVAFVKRGQCCIVELIIADLVEQIDKFGVVLPEDLRQFDAKIGTVRKGFAVEKVWR